MKTAAIYNDMDMVQGLIANFTLIQVAAPKQNDEWLAVYFRQNFYLAKLKIQENMKREAKVIYLEQREGSAYAKVSIE